MTRETPKELFEKGFITEEQFDRIDLITSGKIVSVFYELRILLYLGVMLFTSGVGLFIYQNIGELGHIISIIALSLLTIVCFWYVFKHVAEYSNGRVDAPTPYFDYIVLLGSLLFISVQGYLQFRFGILDESLGFSTLTTATFFFYIAYRFDHAGILSLAITALASFWSISISPQKWYSSNFFSTASLHAAAIGFGVGMAGIALLLDKMSIKKHFTFTYLNFSLLTFFIGAIAGLFIVDWYGFYILLIFAGCVAAYFFARKEKSFLFLLYAFLAAYIATTYLLVDTIFRGEFVLVFYYSIFSCIGFIVFIVKYRNHFTHRQ